MQTTTDSNTPATAPAVALPCLVRQLIRELDLLPTVLGTVVEIVEFPWSGGPFAKIQTYLDKRELPRNEDGTVKDGLLFQSSRLIKARIGYDAVLVAGSRSRWEWNVFGLANVSDQATASAKLNQHDR